MSIIQKEKTAYISEASSLFKLLSDPTRLCILHLLVENPDGLCVYEIAEELNISHSASSHQLTKLESRGIVKGYREGQSMCYKFLDNQITKNILRIIKVV